VHPLPTIIFTPNLPLALHLVGQGWLRAFTHWNMLIQLLHFLHFPVIVTIVPLRDSANDSSYISIDAIFFRIFARLKTELSN